MPLVIADADRAATEVGQRWHVGGLAEAVRSGADAVTARVDDGREIRLDLALTPGERDGARGRRAARPRPRRRSTRASTADLAPTP